MLGRDNRSMKTLKPKTPRTLKPKAVASKPVKLSKSDPNYYSKIGQISAAKRQMTKEQFSAMAKKSHLNRPARSYKGGRKKQDGSAVA